MGWPPVGWSRRPRAGQLRAARATTMPGQPSPSHPAPTFHDQHTAPRTVFSPALPRPTRASCFPVFLSFLFLVDGKRVVDRIGALTRHRVHTRVPATERGCCRRLAVAIGAAAAAVLGAEGGACRLPLCAAVAGLACLRGGVEAAHIAGVRQTQPPASEGGGVRGPSQP
eukprot:COSAG01_NODE_677_length_14312_cov_10.195314_3_plen_169_part_00